MGDELPSQLNLDARWDACHDIALRRLFYSTFAGAASALLLFRSPVTRWATVAFATGPGVAPRACQLPQVRHPRSNPHIDIVAVSLEGDLVTAETGFLMLQSTEKKTSFSLSRKLMMRVAHSFQAHEVCSL
ncbi:hypothetical protein GOP47_0023605 [Adiantum capillus-veneris]|uniref:Uncharacterized protein n=1 Tax=Adiantum capillus-veneris TaxID=13818 RepID=A0A9D4U4A0_ADICA|nr:hypothetical protein GOP47_0023605 [Adiantum capillus-veneris]